MLHSYLAQSTANPWAIWVLLGIIALFLRIVINLFQKKSLNNLYYLSYLPFEEETYVPTTDKRSDPQA